MLFVQLSRYSIPMEIHPRMAWIYRPPGNCRRRGGSDCGGVSRMDAATELTWTYLQRPPRNRTHPAIPQNAAVAFAVEVAGQRPALPLRRVRGAALPANLTAAGDASGPRTAS
ncbi:hypothetical protein FJP69_04490 [Stenotrophomonas maltophilia]|nr:hypothetical protein FJP69_04490 [Stenotrophomonas maltophilia]